MNHSRTRKDIENNIQNCKQYVKDLCYEYMEYERQYLHEGRGNSDTKSKLYNRWKSEEENQKKIIEKYEDELRAYDKGKDAYQNFQMRQKKQQITDRLNEFRNTINYYEKEIDQYYSNIRWCKDQYKEEVYYSGLRRYQGYLEETKKDIVRYINETYSNGHHILLEKASSFISFGFLSEAIECYDKLLKAEPNNITCLTKKIEALNMLQRYKESIECYEKLLKYEPNNKSFLEGKKRVMSSLKSKHNDDTKQALKGIFFVVLGLILGSTAGGLLFAFISAYTIAFLVIVAVVLLIFLLNDGAGCGTIIGTAVVCGFVFTLLFILFDEVFALKTSIIIGSIIGGIIGAFIGAIKGFD